MPHNERRQQHKAQRSAKKIKSRREPVSDSEEITLADIKKLQTNIKKESKSFWKVLQKDRFKRINTSKGPYKSDRWIWNGVLILAFFWLWFVAQSYDYNLDYFKCGDGERLYEGPHQVCKNPFYKPGTAWKSMPELPYGEYGQKPGPLFNSAGYVVAGIAIFGGLLNHVWHNRRFNK